MGKSRSEPIHIEADSLVVRQEDGLAVFEGSVKAVQGPVNIFSDEMTVYYAGEGPQSINGGNIKKIAVYGNVRLVTPRETASGNNGTYDVGKDQIELRGNVVLTQGKNVLTGTRLVHDVVSGKSKLLSTTKKGTKAGRVKGVFMPKQAQLNTQ
ncbi:MAG: lipopolysaccharide transport periplasmic protein LptA [Hyphomicrobiales bacterium]|nr:lipopolysaccharide transport periplasmic protein LptA [Hyphomicrobiales bacterium]